MMLYFLNKQTPSHRQHQNNKKLGKTGKHEW